MKNRSFFIALFIAMFCFQTAEAQNLSWISLDTSLLKTDPYKWANEGWMQNAKIPKGYVTAGVDQEIVDANRKYFSDLFDGFGQGNIPNGLENVAAFYKVYLDTASRNLSNLNELFTLIESLRPDLKNLPEILAELSKLGLDCPWTIWVGPDEKAPEKNILHISQAGIPISAEYFVSESEDAEKLQFLKEYMQEVFKIAGIQSNANLAFDFVGTLGKSSMTTDELFADPEKLYNKYHVKDLSKICNFNWKLYFSTVLPDGIKIDTVIVENVDFLRTSGQLMNGRGAYVKWKEYLQWHVLNQLGIFCSKDLEWENFEFYSSYMNGVKEQRTLKQKAIKLTMATFPNTLGRIFVRDFYDKKKEAFVDGVVINIAREFREELRKGIWWMSKETRNVSIEKLDSMVLMMGYTKDSLEWPIESFEVTNILLQNILNNNQELGLRNMAKLSQRVKRNILSFSAYEVNAGYNPLNTMEFPAGTLTEPYVEYGKIPATYAGIGTTVGHEITHGFDTYGADFDPTGKLIPWWSEGDRNVFDSLAMQFENYCQQVLSPDSSIADIGSRTRDEVIADVYGFQFAFKAMQKALKGIDVYKTDESGFSPAQLFCIAYLQDWRQIMTAEFKERMMTEDEHPINELRANLVIKTAPQFYRAFNLEEDTEKTKLSKLIWSSERPD